MTRIALPFLVMRSVAMTRHCSELHAVLFCVGGELGTARCTTTDDMARHKQLSFHFLVDLTHVDMRSTVIPRISLHVVDPPRSDSTD